MLVLVSPGQGAQTPGLLTPWLDAGRVADRVRRWSEWAGIDLIRYGTTAGAEEIRDTAVAQPLLVATGLAAAAVLFPEPDDACRTVGAVAGHSVGELTVAVATGVFSPESALVLARERGRAMADAAATEVTGMTAVLGGRGETVLAKIAELGLTPANINDVGQIVAAGTQEQLAALAADPPPGTWLRPLEVAGAFHSRHMAPAVDRLAPVVANLPVHDPCTRYLSNVDGTVVHDGREIARRLVSQLRNPVRWDMCMTTMAAMGVTAVIELPPAGTLTGLIRRALLGVETVALRTPDDLAAAHRLIAEHGHPSPLAGAPTRKLVVSPFMGTFRACTAAPRGASLTPGTSIGSLICRRGELPIAAPHGGTLVEWLVEDGDPVFPGQPLARLHPEAVTS